MKKLILLMTLLILVIGCRENNEVPEAYGGNFLITPTAEEDMEEMPMMKEMETSMASTEERIKALDLCESD